MDASLFQSLLAATANAEAGVAPVRESVLTIPVHLPVAEMTNDYVYFCNDAQIDNGVYYCENYTHIGMPIFCDLLPSTQRACSLSIGKQPSINFPYPLY